ncbi:MAG: flagellar motor protein MotB [Terriglobia bacterium]
MSRKKKAAEHVNHERWLISYGDFITLLFALFVVLFASSQVDKRKTIAVAQSIQVAFQQLGVFSSGRGNEALEKIRLLANANPKSSGSSSGPISGAKPNLLRGPVYMKGELSDIKAELGTVLAPQIQKHAVNLRLTREGLVISLQEVGFFDSGSAVMKPHAMTVLSKIGAILSGASQDLRVEGHTDNAPIHNAQYASNWQLSTARATEVLGLLITKFGIAPDRLAAAGYAKYHPVASNATPEGRARNRRVDIVVLRTDLTSTSPGEDVAGGTPNPSPSRAAPSQP